VKIDDQLINEINELSMKYSRGLIQYDEYKNNRTILLEKLEIGENKNILDNSGIFEIVNAFAGIIKRS